MLTLRLPTLTVLCLLLTLAACSTSTRPTAPGRQTRVTAAKHESNLPDFSGHWEKNYQASDNFGNRLQLYFADIRRRIERSEVEATGFSTSGGVDAGAINGLAQFAEEITRMPLLEIRQDDDSIDVERENDFNLRCKYRDRQYVQTGNDFGNEICGWNGDRLLFRMDLAGGLHITHQFSLSRDGSQLNVTTTMASDQVSAPLVISNFYTRFVSQEDNYDCQQTLSRNRVCTQRKDKP